MHYNYVIFFQLILNLHIIIKELNSSCFIYKYIIIIYIYFVCFSILIFDFGNCSDSALSLGINFPEKYSRVKLRTFILFHEIKYILLCIVYK